MQTQFLTKDLSNLGKIGFLWPGIEIFPAQDTDRKIDDAQRQQGQYYAEAIERRDHHEKSAAYASIIPERKKLKKRKLTEDDIKLALSIVGIIKDGLEPDLSERFREYYYKND